MKLGGLHIYPIKSCRGLALTTANVKRRGLEHDRRWMIVDAHGRFITQRSHSILAQLNVLPDARGLTLEFGGLKLRVNIPTQNRLDVSVWSSTVNALVADDKANGALSEWLGQAVRLVYMDAAATRPTNPEWAQGYETSFADGYPVLVTNTASLAAINEHIQQAGHQPIGMARFRPNVVIETDVAWAEDSWTRLQIGEVMLELVKPCTRCVVTTRDPQTGEPRPEPVMNALRALRMSTDPRNKGVLFGVNAVVQQGGKVAKGAAVSVL